MSRAVLMRIELGDVAPSEQPAQVVPQGMFRFRERGARQPVDQTLGGGANLVVKSKDWILLG